MLDTNTVSPHPSFSSRRTVSYAQVEYSSLRVKAPLADLSQRHSHCVSTVSTHLINTFFNHISSSRGVELGTVDRSTRHHCV
jgi:hypothetical protein